MRMGREGWKVVLSGREEGRRGWGREGGRFDWWWCELNRKRLRESFYQARNTSGLKCSCTTPLYNAAAWPHITRRQKPRWELLVIIAPSSARHVKLCWSRKAECKCMTQLKIDLKETVDWQKCKVLVIFALLICCLSICIYIFLIQVALLPSLKENLYLTLNKKWVTTANNESSN